MSILLVFAWSSISTTATDETKEYLNIARYHALLKEYSKSINAYKAYLKKNDDAKAYIEYIHALFWMGNSKKSIDEMEKLLSAKGRQIDLLLEYATILSFSNRFSKAIDIYNEILTKEPDNFSAHLGLSYIYLESSSQAHGGKDHRRKILELKEKFKFSLMSDIKELKKVSDRLIYTTAKTKGISNQQALLELAFLKRNVKRWDESEYYFRKYLENNNDPDVRFELAKTFNWAKNLPKAVEELKILHRNQPKNIKFLHELAKYESWIPRAKDADLHYAKLLQLEPNDANFMFERAENLRWAGKKKEAFQIYNELYQRDSQNKQYLSGLTETASYDDLINLKQKYKGNKRVVTALHNIYLAKKNYKEDIALLNGYLAQKPYDTSIRAELAKTHFYSGNNDQAIIESKKIIDQDKNDKYAIETLPLLYTFSEKFPEAKTSFAKLESKRKLTLDEKIMYGNVLNNLGEKESALKYYRAAYKSSPDNEDLIKRFYELEDAETLEKIFNKNPENRQNTANLASLLMMEKKFSKAELVFKKHLMHDPYDNTSALNLARVLSWQGKFSESIKYYDVLISHSKPEERKVAQLESADVESWAGNYDEAEKRYNKILKDDPEDIKTLTSLSKLFLWNGLKERERETYKKIIEINPTNQYARKMLAKAEDDPSYKIPNLEKRIKENPDDTEAMKRLFELYMDSGDYDKAYIVAKQLAEKDPKNSELIKSVEASRKESSEKTELTILKLKKDILKNPFSKEPRKVLINYLVAKEKNEEAIQEMQKYTMLFPEEFEMRDRLAQVLSWEGRYGQAASEYETLLLKQSDNNRYKLGLARILSWDRKEGYPLAIKLADDVVESDPNNVEAYLIRADVYYYSGNYGKALKDYKKVQEIDGANYRAKKGIEAILDYGSKYLILAEIMFREDNVDFQELLTSLGFEATWNKTLDTSLKYSHSFFMKPTFPNMHVDRIRLKQGLRFSDLFYMDAFIGYNHYLDLGDTLDYGSSLKYNFGWRDFILVGYENVDITNDVYTYESFSPRIIGTDNILFNFVYYPETNTKIDLFSKIGFFEDTNKAFNSNLTISWNIRTRPLIILIGGLRFYRVNDKLYPAPRYWDPSWYFSIVPGVYAEFDITKDVVWFVDFMLGYGIEEGNSELELGADSGFLFKLTKGLNFKVDAFYSQTGRSLNSQNYYQYGVRGLLTYGF